MEIEKIWQDYGLDRLEEGVQSLFPTYRLSAEALFSMTAGLFSQLG